MCVWAGTVLDPRGKEPYLSLYQDCQTRLEKKLLGVRENGTAVFSSDGFTPRLLREKRLLVKKALSVLLGERDIGKTDTRPPR